MLEEMKNLKEALENNDQRGRILEIFLRHQEKEEDEHKCDSTKVKHIVEEPIKKEDKVDGEEIVIDLDQMIEPKEKNGKEEIQEEQEHDVEMESLQHEGNMRQTINTMIENAKDNNKEEDHLKIGSVNEVKKISIYTKNRDIALGEDNFFLVIGKKFWNQT